MSSLVKQSERLKSLNEAYTIIMSSQPNVIIIAQLHESNATDGDIFVRLRSDVLNRSDCFTKLDITQNLNTSSQIFW